MVLEKNKQRSNYRDRIYQDYLVLIQRGEITTDDRLVDASIAAELGVSRMPVRDAMMRLVHEGYLVSTTRGFVLPVWEKDDVLEFFEIRRLLEPRAAGLAAQNITDATLNSMRSALKDIEDTLESGDIQLFYKASEIFRNGWLLSVPNAQLRAAIKRYFGLVQAVRLVTMSDRESHEIIAAGQSQLLAAFSAGDAIGASDSMLSFVVAAEMRYLKLA